jgi:hypothetical protein
MVLPIEKYVVFTHLVNYFGHCPLSFKQGDSYGMNYKYSALDHKAVTLMTFKMPVNFWAFHVESSREQFVNFTLGGRLHMP